MVLPVRVRQSNPADIRVFFHRRQPVFDYRRQVLLHDVWQAPGLDSTVWSSLRELCMYSANQRFDVGGFDEVIIYLLANCLEGAFKSGETGEDKIYRLGLSTA